MEPSADRDIREAVPTPEAPETLSSGGRARSGGCGRGCLIGCAGTTLTIVALLAAAWFVVPSWLDARLDDWGERYPAVGLIVSVAGLGDAATLDPAITPFERREVDAAGEEATRGSDALPSDIVLLTKPESETYRVGADRVVAVQSTEVSVEQAVGTLTSRWTVNGWSLARRVDLDTGRVLIWEKGSRTCQLEASTFRGGTYVWLRCSGSS